MTPNGASPGADPGSETSESLDRPQPGWAWRTTAAPPSALHDAFADARGGAALASVLWGRGIAEPSAAYAFLAPALATGLRPPSHVAHVEAAAERLVASGRRVVVDVDRSVESALAAVVLSEGFAALGFEVDATEATPARVRCAPRALHVDGMVLGDPATPLASTTLAFYLLAAVRAALRRHDEATRADLRRQLDLVALGIIAAEVPLRDEQRVLAATGIAALAAGQRSGLRALAEAAQVCVPSGRTLAARVVPRLAAALSRGGYALLHRLATCTDAASSVELAAAVELHTAAWRADAERAGVPERDGHVALLVDAELPLAALTPLVVASLARLEPCGVGNPEPRFLARDVRVDGARLAGDPARPWWGLRLRQDGRSVRGVLQGRLAVHHRSRGDVVYALRPGTGRGGGMIEIDVLALSASEGD